MEFYDEIYQIMTSTINAFYERKEIFCMISSQTARMYVIKLDMNHLKMQRYLDNKKKLRLTFFQIKKISTSVSQIQN
jgi:hypothetical protein